MVFVHITKLNIYEGGLKSSRPSNEKTNV